MLASVGRSGVVLLLSAAVLLRSTLAGHHSGASVDGCSSDMFDDRQRGAEPGKPNCRPCSRCVPGYGAARLCTRHNDTECYACPAGHYSATKSRLDDCIPCTVCGVREPQLQACTAALDAVCRKYCPIGYFYTVDDDCLPCSSCRDYPQHEANGARVQGCVDDGMAPDMQCRPRPAVIGADMSSPAVPYDHSGDLDNEPVSTFAARDNHAQPPSDPSPRPGLVTTEEHGGKPDDDTGDISRIYTGVLVTLLILVGVCVLLTVTIIVCLRRVIKLSAKRSPYHRTNGEGYQCMSKKTSKLLVHHPTTYV